MIRKSAVVLSLALTACGAPDVSSDEDVSEDTVVETSPDDGAADSATSMTQLKVEVPIGTTLQALARTTLRSSASARGTALKSITANDKLVTVDVTKPAGGYYKVRYKGATGWVHGRSLIVVAVPRAPVASAADGVAILYLVPSDRQVRADVPPRLRSALQAVQAWTAKTGDGRTFSIVDEPVVRIVKLTRTAASLGIDANGGNQPGTFHNNVVDEVFRATGGDYGQPRRVWVAYVDADPPCGSLFGGAAVVGGTGVAVLPANDLRGLAGSTTTNLCTGASEPAQGACRWVGGLGHELGHALGLPHPAGCEQQQPTCDASDLMWMGYASYPNTRWGTADRTLLAQNPLFGVFPVRNPAAACR